MFSHVGFNRHMSQLAYGNVWAAFCSCIALYVNRTKMQQCIERLRVQFSEFRIEGYLIPIHPESLPRYLEYSKHLILNPPLRSHTIYPMGQSPWEAALVNIRTLQDMALRQLLSVNRRELLKFLSYYMAKQFPSSSTEFWNFYYSLDSGESAKMVLAKHSHLLMVDYDSRRETVSFKPLGCLLEFLCNPDRGGSLHIEFRTCCIATCINLVLRILPAIQGYRLVLISFFIYGEYRY